MSVNRVMIAARDRPVCDRRGSTRFAADVEYSGRAGDHDYLVRVRHRLLDTSFTVVIDGTEHDPKAEEKERKAREKREASDDDATGDDATRDDATRDDATDDDAADDHRRGGTRPAAAAGRGRGRARAAAVTAPGDRTRVA